MTIRSVYVVDAVGVLAVAALVWAGVEYGLLDVDRSSQEIRQLSGKVDELREAATRMHASLDTQQEELRSRQEALGDGDLLPEQTPVEDDLRAVSDLARQNNLELIEFTPMGAAQYPGVQETRYRMRTKGRYAQHSGFLRDFQRCASWADITFLKMESPNARTPDDKSGEMTVSLYSATGEPAADSGASGT